MSAALMHAAFQAHRESELEREDRARRTLLDLEPDARARLRQVIGEHADGATVDDRLTRLEMSEHHAPVPSIVFGVDWMRFVVRLSGGEWVVEYKGRLIWDLAGLGRHLDRDAEQHAARL